MYNILEVANCHGGDYEYILSLIEEFKEFEGFGMKFQPLHPDKIATNDFEWYSVYKQLLFSQKKWGEIISKAEETKEIWLDLFDVYGVEIFELYKLKIKGLKLQASILYNENVISSLEDISLSHIPLIINISGLALKDIEERVKTIRKRLNPGEIILQVGFQSYPTKLIDCGLNKINLLKSRFGLKIAFTDHVDGNTQDAIYLPIIAALEGVDLIEKHIMHSSMETKYDFYSAIKIDKYRKFMGLMDLYLSLAKQPFINEAEKNYLNNSIQIPITKNLIKKGTIISIKEELDFKRSGQMGLNVKELTSLQGDYHLLNKDIKVGNTIDKKDFKKATIATIIAGRLKSTRLKRKALLNIGNITSVEQCIKSCLRFKNTNYTILATSDLQEDAELEEYTYDPSVIFHKGDPEDVIQRYLDITNELEIDIVIRVTADMPYVSSEIVEILLDSHFANGADYTVAKHAGVGTAAEIINVAALRKIKQYFPRADYSEYMTWYFQNNPEYFKLNFSKIPDELIRDYRLTLDFEEDLILFNKIQSYLDENRLEGNIRTIFKFLDNKPKIAEINDHIKLKYKSDQKLINILNKKTKIRLNDGG